MRFLKTTAATTALGATMVLAQLAGASATPAGLGAASLGASLGAAAQATTPIENVQFRRGRGARVGPATMYRGGGFRGGVNRGGGFRGGVYRGGGYRGGVYRGGYRGYRGGWGWGGGVAAGVATGALLGSALAAQPYYAPGPYYDGGYVVAGPVASEVEYCMRRFRSYDPRSGTYLGYDGLRHPCP